MVKVIENYILSEAIGEGSYGTVYKAKHKLNQNTYAVKIIPLEKFLEHQKLEEYISNEIETLTTVGDSNHIIHYFEKFKTKHNFYFVYEYCNGGNLFQLLKKQGPMTEKKALKIFRQLLEAFKVLNRYNIMHRDIKPQNILFSDEVVKLADFGFCKGLKPDENLTKTMLGSPIYMAPQVLKGQSYTTKADIWSLGVILYEMIYGICPYQSDSIASLISTVDHKPLTFPQEVEVSEKTMKLIKKMMTKDYFRRMSWVQLFGIQIDEDGSYMLNTSNLASISHESQKKSAIQSYGYKKKNYIIETHQSFDKKLSPTFSKNITESENRKPSSLKKQEKKKIFYSQNYMDIFSKPIDKPYNEVYSPALKKQIDQQTYAQTQAPVSAKQLLISPQNNNKKSELVSYKSFQYTKIENEKQKRQDYLKIHEKCVDILGKTYTEIEKKGINVLSDSYIILKRVQKKLKEVTDKIKITETNLLDMASVINYEIIQVDRLLIEVRNHLISESQIIPQEQEIILSENIEQQLKENFKKELIN